MTHSIPFVYLTSQPYSGSTLVSFLLNAHPKIATVGEMTGIVGGQDAASYRCSCGSLIGECGFWSRIVLAMERRGHHFDPKDFDTRIQSGAHAVSRRLISGSLRFSALEDLRDGIVRLLPKHTERLRQLTDRNIALAQAVLEVTHKDVWFDASKNHMAIRYFRDRPELNFRVIHLVRDVRGASASMRKHSPGLPWRRAVDSWVRGNANMERHVRLLPRDHWMRIRYEDVCKRPQEFVNRVTQFCGLTSSCIETRWSSVEHHILGNRMRLGSTGEIRADETWRKTLTLAEQNYAIRRAARLHQRYGYTETH